MIKTLGPLEDASDLASIAPVLHHWAEVISNGDQHVSLCDWIHSHIVCCVEKAVLTSEYCVTTWVSTTCLYVLCTSN